MKDKASFAFMALSLVALVAALVFPASASEVIIPDADSGLIDTWLLDSGAIMPLAAVSNYTVTVYAGSTQNSYTNSTLTAGTATVYSSAFIGGYYITIPPSSQSGSLYVYGLLPCSAKGSSGWNTGVSAANTYILPPYYILTSSPPIGSYGAYHANTGINLGAPFGGSVYIPAHASNLYLFVYSSANNIAVGAYSSPNSFISFVPDSSGAIDYTFQLNSMLSHVTSIDNQMANLVANSNPSLMDEFESRYIDKWQDQLDKVEDMMSPENTALPNGGDFAGFVSDVQDGLGVNGSSFSASDFADATSKFTGSDSVSAGGPWEFFSQSVQDSLAGVTSAVGLNDDDYIYAWLEEAQRRYGLWSSSSP